MGPGWIIPYDNINDLSCSLALVLKGLGPDVQGRVVCFL